MPPGADEREILMKRKQLTDARDSEVTLEIGNEVERSERSDERKGQPREGRSETQHSFNRAQQEAVIIP